MHYTITDSKLPPGEKKAWQMTQLKFIKFLKVQQNDL